MPASEWQRYRMSWRLASPLHIGYRTIGTIARTRLWVPGKNVWGALIDSLARAQGATPQEPTLFQQVREEVDAGLRFEAWFLTPHTAETPPADPWHPHQEPTGWCYGQATEQQMQRMALGSSVSTAIEHGPGIAEEGMLFETEHIAPRTLYSACGIERNTPLWLVGHLWIASGARLTWQGQSLPAAQIIAQHAQALSLGGEQTKGYGQLVGGILHKWDEQHLTLDDQQRLNMPPKYHLPFLVRWADNQQLRGRIEPIVGRTTTDGNSYGTRLESAQFCWIPGSVSNASLTLRLDSILPGIATPI